MVSSTTTYPADTKMCQFTEATDLVVLVIFLTCSQNQLEAVKVIF
jgi:hypothetical protein